jgi:transposase
MNGVEAVVEGVRRRRRSIAEKRRIVEETLVAGASVAVVARAYGVNANQVFAWRRLYQAGRLGPATAIRGADRPTSLLPVRIEEESARCESPVITPVEHRQQQAHEIGTIHLQFGDVQLRLEGRVDEATLRVVLESLGR